MNRFWMLTTAMACLTVSASAGEIKGEYLESRNADVWTGPCFANAEMGIVGNKAVLAWKVTDGEFNGVKLTGLGVAAVVIGDRTFGIGETVKTKAVLLVDERATTSQREALVAMVKSFAPETVQDIVATRDVPFEMSASQCTGGGCASLKAGDVQIATRCLTHRDCICGHEELAYEPLSKVEGAYAAYTIKNHYTGAELGETFHENNARSAIIARFER